MRVGLVLFAGALLLPLQIHGDGSARADGRLGEAPRDGLRRLRELSTLRSAVEHDPYTREIVKRVREDRGRTISSTGERRAERMAERLGWVPLGADPELRKVTVAEVMRRVRQGSEALSDAIDARPAQAAWDVLFVGASVHSAITANTLSQENVADPLRMLTVEASDDIGGTFRDLGSTISINSANRQKTVGGKVKRGSGDKNPTEGPWAVPDLSGVEHPEARVLADAATINLYASGTDFLMKTRVVNVEFRDEVEGGEAWPAQYRVELRTGAAQRFVYANAVVDATGIGKPQLKGVSPATVELVQRQRATIDFDQPDVVPDLMLYGDAMKLASRSKHGRDPYRAPAAPEPTFETRLIKGLKVSTPEPPTLAIGTPEGTMERLSMLSVIAIERGGRKGFTLTLTDGRQVAATSVTAEYRQNRLKLLPGEDLAGLVDRVSAFATDLRAKPITKKIQVRIDAPAKPRPVTAVVGGGDSGKTFLEYYYGQGPASAYSGDGKVDTAQRGDVGDVEWFVGESGPKDCDAFLKATRSRYLKLTGKVREADGQPSRAKLNQTRVVKVEQRADGRYDLTDSAGEVRVVDKVIFATGFEQAGVVPGKVVQVTGKVEGLKGKRILAKRIQGRGDGIFRIGPAAGLDVVGADEVFSTRENAGSIYAFAPRDRALARSVLRETDRAKASLTVETGKRTLLYPGRADISIGELATRRLLETPLSTVVLRAGVMDVLGKVELDRSVKDLRFTVVARDGQLRLDSVLGGETLAGLIKQSPSLVEQLSAAVAEGNRVEFSVKVKNGHPKRTTLRVEQ